MYSDLALRKFADLNRGAEWEQGNMIRAGSEGVGLHPGTVPRIPSLLSARTKNNICSLVGWHEVYKINKFPP